MKRSIRNKYAMYTAIKQILAQNEEAWKNNAGFSSNIEKLSDLMSEIKQISGTISMSTKPVTARKHGYLDSLTDNAIALHGFLKSLALELEESEFNAQVQISLQQFKSGAAMNRLILFKRIEELAFERMEMLSKYNWTAERHEEFKSLIEKAESEIGTPQMAKTEHSRLRKRIDSIVKDIDEILKTMDLMMYDFKKDSPEFSEKWSGSRQVIDWKSRSSIKEEIIEIFDDENIPNSSEPPEETGGDNNTDEGIGDEHQP